MAVMLGNLYDALRSAGAEDDKARKAAEEIAAYEPRFAKLESDVGSSMDGRLQHWAKPARRGLVLRIGGLR